MQIWQVADPPGTLLCQSDIEERKVSTHFIRRCSECNVFSVRDEEATACITCQGALESCDEHTSDIKHEKEAGHDPQKKVVDEILRLWKLIVSFRHIEWLQGAGESFYFPCSAEERLPRELVFGLSEMGYVPLVRNRCGLRVCILIRTAKRRKKENIALHVILFLLTLVTTTVAGYQLSLDIVNMGLMKDPVFGAFSFSLGLLFILGSHEFAHWYTARKTGILASFPYFIPMIPYFSFAGTLGAMINIKTPPPDRNAMVKLGASGPLVGLTASIIIICLGLKLTSVVEVSMVIPPYIDYGKPLLFNVILLLTHKIPAGMYPVYHPLAIAGWFGLLVNGINLMPVGQLDGGHIARAYMSSRAHAFLSFIVIIVLCILGFFFWKGWYIFAFMCFIITLAGNPGAIEEEKPPDVAARVLSLLAICTFLGSLTLEPVSLVDKKEGRKSVKAEIPVAMSIDRISSAPDRS